MLLSEYCRHASMLPPRLVIPYYVDPDPTRQAELDMAVTLNVATPYLGEIILACEGPSAAARVTGILHGHDPAKIHIHTLAARPTFRDLFCLADDRLLATASSGADAARQVTMLINTDIVLGQKVDLAARDLWRESLSGRRVMLTLSRHELEGGYEDPVVLRKEVGGGSHDLWGWVGFARLPHHIGGMFMGKFFCDGVFAHQLWFHQQCLLKNPCIDAHILHIHRSGIRNYCTSRTHDCVPGQRTGVSHCRISDPWREEDTYDDGHWRPFE
jgi:hypothetical protein